MDTTGIPRKFPCTLTCRSNGPHIQQIYVGFGMLADAGIIAMRQTLKRTQLDDDDRPLHLRDVAAGHLHVEADGIRIAYDVHDSDEIDADLLRGADFYFKRSWNRAAVDTSATPERVLPLGANVWVNAEAPDFSGLKRSWLALNMVDLGKNVVRSLGIDRAFGDRLFTPRIGDLEAEPPIGMPARVLFLAEAWNPATAPTPETAEERVRINRMRAACMRALRDAFGENATCGFRPTEFAAREFGDLVSSEALTLKRNYLATLRQHSICVASSGLHRSIGWKFAEYLSMARAIVSERLHATLPGDLAVGRNYLEFDSPESCLAEVSRLFHDTAAREDMMRRNREYYLANLRPDALVLNTLRTAHAMSAR